MLAQVSTWGGKHIGGCILTQVNTEGEMLARLRRLALSYTPGHYSGVERGSCTPAPRSLLGALEKSPHTQRRASHTKHLHSVQGQGPLLGLLFFACGFHLENRANSLCGGRGRRKTTKQHQKWAKGLVSYIWSQVHSSQCT